MDRLQDIHVVRLLHAVVGMVTEAAEAIDVLKKFIYYGKPLDETNLREEVGDSSWYERILADELGSSHLGIMLQNVRKLRQRYPDKFTEHKATNRDLDAERQVLEDTGLWCTTCGSRYHDAATCTGAGGY
jgi:NTP pyrophosphatase (non-canonical NTP hydrolase)